jgi:hypothetical protein
MRGLKALVIGMGVLITGGIAFLTYSIIEKADVKGLAGEKPPKTQITLPKGAKVMETDIGEGRIIFRLRMQDGSHILLLFDSETGQSVGRIELKPQ